MATPCANHVFDVTSDGNGRPARNPSLTNVRMAAVTSLVDPEITPKKPRGPSIVIPRLTRVDMAGSPIEIDVPPATPFIARLHAPDHSRPPNSRSLSFSRT